MIHILTCVYMCVGVRICVNIYLTYIPVPPLIYDITIVCVCVYIHYVLTGVYLRIYIYKLQVGIQYIY